MMTTVEEAHIRVTTSAFGDGPAWTVQKGHQLKILTTPTTE